MAFLFTGGLSHLRLHCITNLSSIIIAIVCRICFLCMDIILESLAMVSVPRWRFLSMMYISICSRFIIILSWKGVLLSSLSASYPITFRYSLFALHRDCVVSSKLCYAPSSFISLLSVCSVVSSDKHSWIRLLSVHLHIAFLFRDTPRSKPFLAGPPACCFE